MESELTIQQVADATGLTLHTLRYYEKAGLLPGVERNAGGHRRYQRSDVDWLLFLMRLRLTGMPIHKVREYFELVQAGDHTVDARGELLKSHRESVLNQIQELEKNLKVLNFKIDLYERGWTPIGPHDPDLMTLRDICMDLRAEMTEEKITK